MDLKFKVNRLTSSQKLAIIKIFIMKRIVIYRLGSIGDTVIALPCFKLIKSSYPNHKILVLTNVPVSDKTAPLMSVLGCSIMLLVPSMLCIPRPAQSAQLQNLTCLAWSSGIRSFAQGG